jgi:hypothetical protein
MVDIIYCKLCDGDKSLLLEAMSNILQETGAHDLEGSRETAWNWQYQDLPTGESYVYVAKFKNKIIGYYHISCYEFKVINQTLKIGHIHSVAILGDYRGKGLFQNLAEFANKDINNFVDAIYTFPNTKSIHTFTKYNKFNFVSSLPIYILPLSVTNIFLNKFKFLKSMSLILYFIDYFFFILFYKSLDKNESIKRFYNINSEIENIFCNFGNKNNVRITRNKEFLNWRYLSSPKGTYKIYGLTHKEILKAIVILKEEKIYSFNGLVVMDFAYESHKDFQKLLSNLFPHIDHKSNDSESFILISGLNEGINSLKHCGFIPIPQRFVPRKLNLLVRWTKKDISKHLTDPSSWLITVGDWDVF